MLSTEQDILEAVRDWFHLESARRAGVATMAQTLQAQDALFSACEEHCNEHDGEYPVSEAEGYD